MDERAQQPEKFEFLPSESVDVIVSINGKRVDWLSRLLRPFGGAIFAILAKLKRRNKNGD